MKTAILGAGKMGVWFAKFCQNKGDNVILADRKKEKLNQLGRELGVETADIVEAVKAADRIMICVSISSFEGVVKKIAPVVRQNQVIMDICSIKEFPVNVMHQNIKSVSSVLSIGAENTELCDVAAALRRPTGAAPPFPTTTNNLRAGFDQAARNFAAKHQAEAFAKFPKLRDYVKAQK